MNTLKEIVGVVENLIKERDEHAKSAGQRWKELDAERQDHAITKRELADAEARCEVMRAAIKAETEYRGGGYCDLERLKKCLALQPLAIPRPTKPT